ncbi:MAG: Fe-S cluster assembly protein SufD [Dehalococcoidia bacterium]|jgi:Fe-S cluster assembly protein SufD|nr:Fe-S cluster assembly protein SufD [Dehalococcoidia bacterium]
MADTSTGAITSEAFTEAAVVAAAAARNEPQWLIDRRAEAARAFAATPMPSTQLRPWKYTDVSDLDFGAFPVAAPTVTVTGAEELVDAIAAGHPVGGEETFARLIPPTEGKFIAANTALWEQGVTIDIPAGAVTETPIVIEIESHEDGAASVFPRLHIHARERAEATIVVHLRSNGSPLLVAGVTEVYADQGAKVRLLFDNRWGADTQDYSSVRSKLGRDSDVRIGTLAFGSRIFKQTVEALIEGEGANSEIRGVALGADEQHFDFVTLQDHIGPRSTSNVEIKSALAGSSKSIYYGITRVEPTAGGSEANQVNRNLLLSGHSKADSDPVLEILTADVIRCGHGATVGPVDQEALFYLQSRGLTERSSLQLLVSGFFNSVAQTFPIEGLEQVIHETVVDKLATAEL